MGQALKRQARAGLKPWLKPFPEGWAGPYQLTLKILISPRVHALVLPQKSDSGPGPDPSLLSSVALKFNN